jgi:uncharacterized alpha-E superfamily protein
MDIISVGHSVNLYWLGRYIERVYTTLGAFFDCYDTMLDGDKDAYKVFLDKLGIEDCYQDHTAFVQGFLYNDFPDVDGFFSVDTAFRRAYDNAMVIRDIIGSESLAYIHLAQNAFHYSRDARNLRLALMPAIDYIVAFWGSIDDKLASGQAGTIVKCGKLIERLDLYFRFSADHRLIDDECGKLCHILRHIRRKDTPFSYNAKHLAVLVEVIGMEEGYVERADDALDSLARLFDED